MSFVYCLVLVSVIFLLIRDVNLSLTIVSYITHRNVHLVVSLLPSIALAEPNTVPAAASNKLITPIIALRPKYLLINVKNSQFKTRCKGDKSNIVSSRDHFCEDTRQNVTQATPMSVVNFSSADKKI